MAMLKRDTVRFSSEIKDRTIALLRTLVRSRYFPELIPAEAELSRLLRTSRSAVAMALQVLLAENIISQHPSGHGWIYNGWTHQPPVGEVAFTVNTDILRGWYSLFQDWLIGFENVMFGEGYETRLLSDFQSPLQKIEKLRFAWEHGTMGFVLASYTEPSICRFFAESGIPAALLGNASTSEEELGRISSDNRAGMEKMLAYVLGQNHSQISFYSTGLNFHDGFRERFSSYQSIMHQYGLEPRMDLAFKEPHNEMSARKAAEILYGLPTKPTAVICGCDREAFELIAELKHLEVEVPKHISICGFDNNHFGQILEPALTTIDIFAVEMGRVAANYLLNEMQVRQMPVKIMLPTQLIVRNSVSPIGAPDAAPPIPPRDLHETGSILAF